MIILTILALILIPLLSSTLYWRTFPLLILAFLLTLGHVLQNELSSTERSFCFFVLLISGPLIALLTPVVQLLCFENKKREVSTSIVPLYQPEGHAELDIVAVHGLGSNPDSAWVHKGTKNFWLRDCLGVDLQKARILAFNHESDWEVNTPQETLKGYGNSLLNELERFRGEEEKNRPVIFIGHSFGGTIIKQALVTASEKPKMKELKDRFGGVIFLGTPHGGSSASRIGSIKALTTYWLGSKTDLLVFLQPGSLENSDLNKRYLDAYPEIEHCDFYETKEEELTFHGIRISMGVVVSKESAVLTRSGATEVAMGVKHRELNKFESISDVNYQKVKSAILKMWEGVKAKERAPSLGAPEGNHSFLTAPTTASQSGGTSSFLNGPTTAGGGFRRDENWWGS
ncbi:Alpha/Beta hydrolase protein [Tuber brumale]|nr:Alpha/Beta hydrolase protein [Tuber brumale]